MKLGLYDGNNFEGFRDIVGTSIEEETQTQLSSPTLKYMSNFNLIYNFFIDFLIVNKLFLER